MAENEIDDNEVQPKKGPSTKTKIQISVVVGLFASGFAWLISSMDPVEPQAYVFDPDESEESTEYSTPEILLAPSHLMKRVRDEGMTLTYWVDDDGTQHFKTINEDGT
jgi:hypothetical protein